MKYFLNKLLGYEKFRSMVGSLIFLVKHSALPPPPRPYLMYAFLVQNIITLLSVCKKQFVHLFIPKLSFYIFFVFNVFCCLSYMEYREY